MEYQGVIFDTQILPKTLGVALPIAVKVSWQSIQTLAPWGSKPLKRKIQSIKCELSRVEIRNPMPPFTLGHCFTQRKVPKPTRGSASHRRQ
jgi:hypothetical protein